MIRMVKNQKKQVAFSTEVAGQVKRKLKAQKNDTSSVWSGFAVFGIVGWSITVPTLLGAIAGVWLDTGYPQSFSWTITLLLVGVVTGCAIAWKWINKENKEINQNNQTDE